MKHEPTGCPCPTRIACVLLSSWLLHPRAVAARVRVGSAAELLVRFVLCDGRGRDGRRCSGGRRGVAVRVDGHFGVRAAQNTRVTRAADKKGASHVQCEKCHSSKNEEKNVFQICAKHTNRLVRVGVVYLEQSRQGPTKQMPILFCSSENENRISTCRL